MSAISQLVELQTKALTAPTAIAPATRQRAIAPTQLGVSTGAAAERKYRPRGQNEELIHQAINAIMQHNDSADRHDDKWAITINGLKGLGIKSQHAITRALEERKKEIDDHHAKHQIDAAKHNLRHRGKTQIGEVMRVG